MRRVVTVRELTYPTDLTDEQWDLLEPCSTRRGNGGRKHADDLRSVDAMLYIAQTGRQWRFRPESYGRATFHDRGGPCGSVWRGCVTFCLPGVELPRERRYVSLQEGLNDFRPCDPEDSA